MSFDTLDRTSRRLTGDGARDTTPPAPEPAEPVRLVLSFELAIPVVERLALLQEELEDPIRQLGGEPRWTGADRLHVVLRILEMDEPDLQHRIYEGIQTVVKSTQPFAIRVKGTRFHPSDSVPRCVLSDVDDEDGRLAAFARRLDASLASVGVSAEPGDRTPVVSIGRIRSSDVPPRLQGVARPYSETDFGASTIRELVVTRTGLIGSRDQRRVMRRFEFGSGR